MKKYKVIDLQGGSFMGDTYEEPMTASEIRSRFWGLDEARTIKYSQFTLEYIAGTWGVGFEEVKL